MTQIFMFSLNAVMPILLLALLGYFLKRVGFFDDSFFKKANTMVFKIFLPFLLFKNVYDINSLADLHFSSVIYCVIAILVLCLLGYISAKIFSQKRNQVGVLTQCTFRSNYAIIGIPLAEALGGGEAVAFASILSAVTIPLFNILAVMLLSHYSGHEHEASVKSTIKKTAKNPLILGVLAGVAVVVIRGLLPVNELMEPVFTVKNNLPFLYTSLDKLSQVASPLALVVLGARFDFAAVKELIRPIFTGTFMRMVIAPLVGIGGAVLLSEYTDILSFNSVQYPALIALFSTPVAVSSAVMVGEIGGDEQLANQLVVWTSVLSMFSMFLIIFAMKSFALI